jgi:hypothetical protein
MDKKMRKEVAMTYVSSFIYGSLNIGLPDVPVSQGQSPVSDSCPRRKSVPGMSPVLCKLPRTSLVFVNSKTNKLNL